MPRNATTGVYTRPVNSFSDPTLGEVIDPTDAATLFNDQDDTGFNGIFGGAIRTGLIAFDTVAAAEAATIDPAVIGSITTNGYYTAGDGGGGTYKQVVAEPTGTDKIQTADGQWWQLAFTTYPSALQLGVKNDGSDQTTAINAAIATYASSTNLGVANALYFPAGIYAANNITIPGIIRVIGAGEHETEFLALNAGDATYFMAGTNWINNGSPSNTDLPFYLEYCAVNGAGFKNNVIVNNGYEHRLDHVFVFGCTANTGTNYLLTSATKNGSTGGGGGDHKFTYCYFGYGTATAGYQFRIVDPGNNIADSVWNNNLMEAAVLTGFYVQSGGLAGWTFTGTNHSFACGNYDWDIRSIGQSFNFSGFYVEGNIKITVDGPATCTNSIGPGAMNGRMDIAFGATAVNMLVEGVNFGTLGSLNSLGTLATHIITVCGGSVGKTTAFTWNGGAANPSIIALFNVQNSAVGKIMNGVSAGSAVNTQFFNRVWINNTVFGENTGTAVAVYQPNGSVSFLSADNSGASLDGDTILLRNRAKSLTMIGLSATAVNFNSATPPTIFGSTSGSIAIVAPAVAGANTITVPAETATLATIVTGTWTPAITTDGTVGTPAYNIQYGDYRRIGNSLVIAWFNIDLSGWTGGPTGNVRIGGLPFTSANTANDVSTCTISYYSVTGLAASNYGITANISPNTTFMNLLSNGNTGASLVTAAQAGATMKITGIAIYHT